MRRAYCIAIEFGFCLLCAVALWGLLGTAGSFVSWSNQFHPDTGSMFGLRLMLLIAVGVASWRTYYLIKNDKI